MESNSEITEKILEERGFVLGVRTDKERLYVKIEKDRIIPVWVKFSEGKYTIGRIPTTDLFYDVSSVRDLDEKIKDIQSR